MKCSIKQEAIKFFDDYSLMMSEAKSKARKDETKGKVLKIFIHCIKQKELLKKYTGT